MWHVLLLGLFVVMAMAAQPIGIGVRVGAPVSMVEGRTIRIDFMPKRDSATATVGKQGAFEIVSIHACAGVDMPFIAYSAANAAITGCNSPGYRTEEIFSDAIRKDPAGSLATKFRVRQRGQAIYMRRRLVDLRTPIVNLQIVIRRGAVTRTIVRSYRVPEKIVSILDPDVGGEEVETKHNNFLGIPGKDDGIDDQPITQKMPVAAVVVAPNDLLLEPTVAQRTMFLGAMFLCMMGVTALTVYYRVTKENNKKTSGAFSTGAKNAAAAYGAERDAVVRGFIKAGADKGVFAT